MISYTISESYKNEIEKSTGTHCFNFLKEMLTHMIMMNYMSYEREDYKLEINEETEENPIFYNNIRYGYNDWTPLYEPVI